MHTRSAKKVLAITGAAGFVGSRCLEWLSRKSSTYEVLAVDHPLVPEKLGNLSISPSVPFYEHHDFIERIERQEIQPDIIIHLGACSSTTESSWRYLAENNLNYSKKIWEWCAKNQKQLVYASSAATYGDGAQGFDDELPINRLQPLNLYAKSKHDFDLWVEEKIATSRQKPSQSVGLKFFNVFGPGEAHKGPMASMVYHGWKQIIKTGSVRLFKSYRSDYPDGGQSRDFIYVFDVISTIQSLIENPHVSGLFNLGSGKQESFKNLTEAVFAALGRKPKIEYISMPPTLIEKYQYHTQATMKKITKSGITPVITPLREAVGNYVDWLKNT